MFLLTLIYTLQDICIGKYQKIINWFYWRKFTETNFEISHSQAEI